MKKFSIAIFAVILITLLAGCTRQFTEDYLMKFEAFLSHSLGDFEAIINGETQDFRYMSFPIVIESYRLWELQYVRHNGEVHTFRFDNLSGLGASNLGSRVTRYARRISENDIRQNIGVDYFAPDELRVGIRWPQNLASRESTIWRFTPEVSTFVLIDMHFQNDPCFRSTRFADVLDSQNGLQLHSITPKELITDWEFVFGLSAISQDYESYEYVIERLKAMTITLAAYLELEKIDIGFMLICQDEKDTCNISFEGHYNRKTGLFEIRTFADMGFNSNCCG